MSRDRRRAAERRGRRAEALAALWLQLSGWRILDRRARTGAGELDLVARRGGVLAFIEVKERSSLEAGLEAVGPRQRARLIRAGSLWQSRRSDLAAMQPRYDLIVIAPWRWPRHQAAAFDADAPGLRNLI
ncbi:MAG: YraN family protein [Oceanicaulis sp.]|nr:YraN family protein [Oceanicaulis sp.]